MLFKKETHKHVHYHLDYQDNLIEVEEYNPETDTLCIFVGNENEIPPRDVMEDIKDKLDEIEKCTLIIFPGIFRLLVLKNNKEK